MMAKKKDKYEKVWDRFMSDVDIELLKTPSEFQRVLLDWLNPNIKRRIEAVQKLTEEFWERRLREIEELPKRLAWEYFPERVDVRDVAELAIERALRFPAEERNKRFGAFYGTFSGLLRKGVVRTSELIDLFRYIVML